MRREIAALLLEYPLARWLALPIIVAWTALWGYLAWKLGPFGRPGWKSEDATELMSQVAGYAVALAVWLCFPVFLFGAGLYAVFGLLLIQFK